ncbi:hypothetical protein GCM10010294_57080 [Streptomyces griseoloalbus]|nr:hypothetical protein GCM10010294_57080 [Streptomyces griseoloalbus]
MRNAQVTSREADRERARFEEAVYLGERVIVLSASPTVVREQPKVDLPVERDRLSTRGAALRRAADPCVRADPVGEARDDGLGGRDVRVRR